MRRLTMKFTLALFVSMLAGAAAAEDGGNATPHPAPAPVPLAVQAMSKLGLGEHFPVKGDSGPTSWSTGTYSYDPAGNVTVIGSQFFLYDTNSRLKTASISSGAGSTQQGFTYDEYGNLKSIQLGTTTTTQINVTAGTNHLLGTGMTYDDAGNLKTWTDNGDSFTYVYDGANMMQQVTEQFNFNNILYVYTADDQRIWIYDVPSGTSRWKIRDLDGKVLREFLQIATGWSVPKDYFYRDGLLLAAVAPSSGATEHFSLDHLGTPRLITDQNAVKIGFHIYFPYGQEWFAAGLQESPVEVMKFTGHERDPDLSGNSDVLDYMHARHYNTPIGRFLSIDPVLDQKMALTNPQAWNRYSYALGNPLRYTDPDGRFIGLIYALRAMDATDSYIKRQAHMPMTVRLPNWLKWDVLLNFGPSPAHFGPTPQMSQAGFDALKVYEGWFTHLYVDTGGHCTIGWGHLVNYGACGASAVSQFGGGITKAQGEQLLAADAIKDTRPAFNLVTVTLSQGQVNAIGVLAFNIGPGAFGKSSILDSLNNNNFGQATVNWLKYNRSGGHYTKGLYNRRLKELGLFWGQ